MRVHDGNAALSVEPSVIPSLSCGKAALQNVIVSKRSAAEGLSRDQFRWNCIDVIRDIPYLTSLPRQFHCRSRRDNMG
jgi:hypothetical protein